MSGIQLCYNENMPKHLVPVLSLLAAILLLVMVNFTTPADVGPLGVLVFFAACYMVVLGVSLLFVKVFMKLAGKKMGRRGYLYAAIIAFGPIMLLLAQSLGTLSWITLVLVAVVIFLACFLVSKRG